MRGSEPGFHLRILETIALLQTHNLAHPELIIKQWPHSDAFLKIKVLFPSSSKVGRRVKYRKCDGWTDQCKGHSSPLPDAVTGLTDGKSLKSVTVFNQK